MSDLELANERFLRDLLAAVRAWRQVWWLPVISVLLGSSVWSSGAERLLTDATDEAAAADVGVFPIVLLAVSLAELGWFGTEREVYRRVWTRADDPAEGLFRLTAGFVPRFVRLGLLVGWPLLLLPLALDPERPGSSAAVAYAVTLALFVAVTFVTPELAYRTPSATGAVKRGFATLRQHFAGVRWHVLLPPLVIVTLGAAAGSPGVPEVARFGFGVIASLAGLAAKGAIARRWLILSTEDVDDLEPQRVSAAEAPR